MSTFAQTNGRTIEQAFEEFDRKNPHVYESFKKYLREIVNAGKRRTSAKLIINRIRWEQYIATDSDDEFTINDAFSSHYARKFIREHPAYNYLFEMRRLRS